MRPLATFLDATIRRLRIAGWNLRGRKFYICHLAHENDRASTQILVEYFKWVGVNVAVMKKGKEPGPSIRLRTWWSGRSPSNGSIA